MKIIDAVLSQAVADAIGGPFEFGDPSRKMIQEYMSSEDDLYLTDDTQMVLFGIEGILAANPYNPEMVEKSYRDWYATQMEPGPDDIDFKGPKSGLLSEQLMYIQEAPGNTCLGNLSRRIRGANIDETSCGCGSVMRTLPFVLFTDRIGSRPAAMMAAIDAGNYTHGHPQCIEAIDRFMTFSYDRLDNRDSIGIPQMSAHDVWVSSKKSITAHGEGWTAMSCMNMAQWAVMNSKTYDELLLNSICHKGDSDSVAAVAGGIWGLTRGGYEFYVHRLKHYEIIRRLLGEHASTEL